MIRRLAVVTVCGGCAVLGGAAAEVLRASRTATAQNQPADPERAAVAALSDRFQGVITKVGPAVVAVDAVKPAEPKSVRPKEESGSGVRNIPRAVQGVLGCHFISKALHARVAGEPRTLFQWGSRPHDTRSSSPLGHTARRPSCVD